MSRIRPLNAALQERTLLIVKGDGVQRGLVGKILGRFEDRGYKIAGMKIVLPTRGQAEAHYADHRNKPFFQRACRFLCAGPVVPVALEGREAIKTVRAMCGGKTEPLDCSPGTVRGDYGVHWRRNLVHSSDSAESAARELALWFTEGEILTWDQVLSNWIYELENAPATFEDDGLDFHPGHLDGVPPSGSSRHD
mmetsp:Transcript_19728/g.55460  ORF Transcript_19728/g.55460 Transcript_19728/m.55460 type:complete len:194 (-) Transcript_19728:129-710(-)